MSYCLEYLVLVRLCLVLKTNRKDISPPTIAGVVIRTKLFQLLHSRLLHISPSTSTCIFPSILINTADQCNIHLDRTNGKPRSRFRRIKGSPYTNAASASSQTRHLSVVQNGGNKRNFASSSHFSSHAFKSNGFRTPSKSSLQPVEKLKLKLNKAKSLQRKPHGRPPGARLISYKCL